MMNHDLEVSETVRIQSPPDNVWDLMTNPERIKEYLFGTQTITDWKTGSAIVFQGVYGEKGEFSYRDKGIVLENIPMSKLSYSYWSGFTGLEDLPENYATVTYSFKADGDDTLFTWTQKGYATPEGHEHSRSGMTAFLQQIKEIAERKA